MLSYFEDFIHFLQISSIFFISACNCSSVGSINSTCQTYGGQCHCKQGVGTRDCSSCLPGFYDFSATGCKRMSVNVKDYSMIPLMFLWKLCRVSSSITKSGIKRNICYCTTSAYSFIRVKVYALALFSLLFYEERHFTLVSFLLCFSL